MSILRVLLSVLAFSAFASLTWWAGPLMAIGQARPFEAAWARLLGIAILAVLIFTPLVCRLIRQRRSETALKKGITQADEKANVQQHKLQEIFSQAVNTLRANQKKGKWYESKKGLYELPWYILIGPPGSGKTTLLQHAGLHFPLQGTDGQASLQGVGGTRHCDWWFTDQAVMIDTAGRFTTQDSDERTDAKAWQTFLKLLKTNRPKQPINGVVLAISVHELLASTEERQNTAAKLRLRLQELMKGLEVCPPIYLLITKMDLLEGFRETYNSLSDTDRARAWGINFPYPAKVAQLLANEAPAAGQSNLFSELDVLSAHLGAALNERLAQEALARNRSKMFEFTWAFAQLKGPLLEILGNTFQASQLFETEPLLRGVYFTSGTQEGNAIDRIVSGLAGLQKSHGGQAAQVVSSGKGKSFFIRDMLAKVVFQEQHLVGYVPRKAWLEKTAYFTALGLSGVLGIAAIGLWAISHANNQKQLAATQAQAETLAAELQTMPTEPAQHRQAVFAQLDALDAIARQYPLQLNHNGGLNQAGKMSSARQQSLRGALETALMPHINQRLERTLEDALLSDPELAYEALKAYLMLHQPQHLDLQTLQDWVLFDWGRHVIPALDTPVQATAQAHLKAALALGKFGDIAPLNQGLVDRARQLIAQQSLESRLYQRLVRLYPRNTADDFTVSRAAGPNAAAVFSRQSGQPLHAGASSLYTPDGYTSYFLPGLATQAAQLGAEHAWVMRGADLSDSLNGQSLSQGVRQLYINDYIAQWQGLLDDVKVQNPKNFDQSVELARLLASPQSPVRLFLQAASENTKLVGKAGAVLDRATNLANQKVNQQVQRTLPSNVALLAGSDFKAIESSRPLEQQVDDHFAGLNQLFDEKAPAYNQVAAILGDLYTQLSAVANAARSQGTPPSADQLAGLQVSAGVLPEPVRTIVTQLSSQGAAKGRAAERASLSAELRPLQEVCQRTIANRYPVQNASSLDILSDDFARFFGPGGHMDQFYQSRLAHLVDTGASTWRYKPLPDGSRPAGDAALVQFQRAARIRDVFFPASGQQAAFSVEMRLVGANNPNDVFYLEHNGKMHMFSMQFDPAHRIAWGGLAPTATLRFRASEGAFKNINGPWALFRLFDTAQVQASGRAEQIRTSLSMDGKRFDFEVTANSAFNPLALRELRQFSCPGGL